VCGQKKKDQHIRPEDSASDFEEKNEPKRKICKQKSIKFNEEEYVKLIQERDTYKDKYYRLAADFENSRKRMDREKQEFIKYANEKVMREFLDILDDLERLKHTAQEKYSDDESFLKGIQLVVENAYSLIQRNGVKAIDAKGKLFDPHYHEVLLQEETNQEQENTVLEELQRGYMLNDKVLRTSKVKIARNKTDINDDSNPIKIKIKDGDET